MKEICKDEISPRPIYSMNICQNWSYSTIALVNFCQNDEEIKIYVNISVVCQRNGCSHSCRNIVAY